MKEHQLMPVAMPRLKRHPTRPFRSIAVAVGIAATLVYPAFSAQIAVRQIWYVVKPPRANCFVSPVRPLHGHDKIIAMYTDKAQAEDETRNYNVCAYDPG
jgi:hypothetical protein